MRHLTLFMVALSVMACSGSAATEAPAAAAAGTCAIPPASYDDLAACSGASEQIELEVADSFEGKTLGRIAVDSRDPQAILSAMGAYTAEWSTGADSFTVFAYGSADDYENAGVGYNRGRIFWNDGGPITVDICTEWEAAEGAELCTEEEHFTVENR